MVNTLQLMAIEDLQRGDLRIPRAINQIKLENRRDKVLDLITKFKKVPEMNEAVEDAMNALEEKLFEDKDHFIPAILNEDLFTRQQLELVVAFTMETLTITDYLTQEELDANLSYWYTWVVEAQPKPQPKEVIVTIKEERNNPSIWVMIMIGYLAAIFTADMVFQLLTYLTK